MTNAQLAQASKFGKALKTDRIISAVKSRLAIPGGYFNFDLPIFYLWLNLSQHERDQHVEQWMQHFDLLAYALGSHLDFIRQSAIFESYHASSNVFQRESTGDAMLLRIQLPAGYGIYPQVSGNQSCFSIRFLSYYEGQPVSNIDFRLSVY